MNENTVAEKEIVFDADRCTGCRICELACSMTKHGEYAPKKSLIRLMTNEEAEVYIPALDIRCDFCGDCVRACSRNALRIVKVEEAIILMKDTKMGRFPIPRYIS